MNDFEKKLSAHGLALKRMKLQTLQINVGRKCNQTCRHCHVDAAPWRTEMMPEPVARRVGEWNEKHRPPLVDITGGAPELSDHFSYFVETARDCGSHIIDRNNLTIIETAAYAWLPEYFAEHEVEVVASLPCYLETNVVRFVKILQRFLAHSQFVIITHNKHTIAMADILYGVTMQEHGVSKIVSVKFHKADGTQAAVSPPEEEAETVTA